jgi:uncharacterized protein with HEPN domain
MVEATRRITEYLRGLDYAAFVADPRTQDAVVRNLEIVGEAARALPDEVKDAAPEIEWRKIIGLRNILVHQYFGVNLPIIWDLVQAKLAPLAMACERLSTAFASDAEAGEEG